MGRFVTAEEQTTIRRRQAQERALDQVQRRDRYEVLRAVRRGDWWQATRASVNIKHRRDGN